MYYEKEAKGGRESPFSNPLFIISFVGALTLGFAHIRQLIKHGDDFFPNTERQGRPSAKVGVETGMPVEEKWNQTDDVETISTVTPDDTCSLASM
jgi:hypothetical protein